MRNRKGLPLDNRGYRAGEKTRILDPQEVMWARGVYHTGEWSARELAGRFGLSLDATRRMLRGDTYANVGEAIPREPIAHELDDGGALERLRAHQAQLDAQGLTPEQLRERANPPARVKTEANAMLDELMQKGAKPVAPAISAADGFGVDEAGETEASRSAHGNLFEEDK